MPQAPQQHPPQQQYSSQATQKATEDLKLALFGPPKQDMTSAQQLFAPPKQDMTPAQQKTEDLKMTLFGGLRPDPIQPLTSPKKEEV